MPDSDKIQEFLDKLKPCIDKGELDACVDDAAWSWGDILQYYIYGNWRNTYYPNMKMYANRCRYLVFV